MKPTLLIMAAGIGNRYGGDKQFDQFGPNSELLVDYSVYDAVRAGFGKVVVVVRLQTEGLARRAFANFATHVPTEFVYQELTTALQSEFAVPAHRTKPWGTAHAILSARTAINEPFAVINADDFYGRDAFAVLHAALTQTVGATTYAMVGYKLRNTLSEYGTVSRGLCEVDASGCLKKIVEHTKIGSAESAVVSYTEAGEQPLTGNEMVSMNCWGFDPSFFDHLDQQFKQFLQEQGTSLTAEFYIPTVVDRLIKAGTVRVHVLNTDERWFGVTYRDDVPVAQQSIVNKIRAGEYPEELWPETGSKA